jgi:hypothetical protein
MDGKKKERKEMMAAINDFFFAKESKYVGRISAGKK